MSERSVRNHCADGCVPHRQDFWNIPENAEKSERKDKSAFVRTLLSVLQDEKSSTSSAESDAVAKAWEVHNEEEAVWQIHYEEACVEGCMMILHMGEACRYATYLDGYPRAGDSTRY